MPVYQHFRESEYPFIDRVFDWLMQVRDHHTIYVTDFLNPRERKIIRSVIGEQNDEVHFSFFGGFDEAERKRAVIAPYYIDINEEDFELVALEADFLQKFVTIEHRDVLGAFMSLGIDRKMIGDIFIQDGQIQLITTQSFKDLFIQQLKQIKRSKVSFKEIDLSSLQPIKAEWILQDYIVSSLRLDVILKSVYHLSRKNAVKLIQSERVQLNYQLEDDPAILLREGDLLSVRGYGRCKVMKLNGKTRKNKLIVNIGQLS